MSLVKRYAKIRERVGGNYEKSGFSYTFGASVYERSRITPPGKAIRRIISELDFALKLDDANNGKFSEAIDRSLAILENSLDAEGVLTDSACREAEAALMALKDASKEYEIIFASHAHIDMNWMWGYQETIAITIATFRTVLNLMREYPDFTFSQSQASVYSIIEEYAPEMMDEIKSRISEGRWEVTATAWVETDKNMPDTESLIRHIEYTRNYLEANWAVKREDLELDFSPDTFGHSAFVPEINTFGGVKYYYHCRGFQDELTLYRYKCPSGSEILMYKEPYWYNSGVNSDCGTGIFGLSKRYAGLKTGLVVYGVGDHGGGPTRRDIENVIEMSSWPIFPTMRFGTVREFFKKAESVREKLPVIEHELNAIFAGCYTTQSRIKRANRKTEQMLLDSERFSAFASMLAQCPPQDKRLEKAWRNVLFTHFHDILTGSCVQESREHAMGLFASSIAHGESILARSLSELSKRTDTSMFVCDGDIANTQSEGAGAGFGLSDHTGVPNPERNAGKTRVYTVFNTSNSDKSEPVVLTVWDYTGDLSRLEAVDSKGKNLDIQLLDNEPVKYWDHLYVRVLVMCGVKANGYISIALREKELTDYPTYYLESERTETPKGDITLENEYIKAVFDGRSGRLCSFIDKETGKEQLSSPAGLNVVYTEKTTSDAWRIGRYLKVDPVDDSLTVTPISGSLISGVESEHKMLNSTVKTTVTLAKGAKALKYAFSVDWHESAINSDRNPVLIFSLPLKDNANKVLMDIPAGAVEREARAMDLPALSYAAAMTGERCPYIVTDCKYGYRLDRNELISTLINTSGGPDPYPERGIHAITLFVGVEKPCPKKLGEAASSLLKPMTGIPTGSHTGELASDGCFIEFSSPTALLKSIAAREDSYVARINEVCGIESKVTLKLPFEIRSAYLTDLEGTYKDDVDIDKDKISFSIGAHKLLELVIRG